MRILTCNHIYLDTSLLHLNFLCVPCYVFPHWKMEMFSTQWPHCRRLFNRNNYPMKLLVLFICFILLKSLLCSVSSPVYAPREFDIIVLTDQYKPTFPRENSSSANFLNSPPYAEVDHYHYHHCHHYYHNYHYHHLPDMFM